MQNELVHPAPMLRPTRPLSKEHYRHQARPCKHPRRTPRPTKIRMHIAVARFSVLCWRACGSLKDWQKQACLHPQTHSHSRPAVFVQTGPASATKCEHEFGKHWHREPFELGAPASNPCGNDSIEGPAPGWDLTHTRRLCCTSEFHHLPCGHLMSDTDCPAPDNGASNRGFRRHAGDVRLVTTCGSHAQESALWGTMARTIVANSGSAPAATQVPGATRCSTATLPDCAPVWLRQGIRHAGGGGEGKTLNRRKRKGLEPHVVQQSGVRSFRGERIHRVSTHVLTDDLLGPPANQIMRCIPN